MNLEDVLNEIAQGNLEALGSLYQELRVPVYHIVMCIVGQKQMAEDVTQETFIRVYAGAKSYQPGTNPKAWVISIARNLAIDNMRSRRKHSKESEISAENQLSNGPLQEESILNKMQLHEALLLLDEIDRQIVVMHVIAGLRHREISNELRLPPGTIRWRYRKALIRLSEIIWGETRGYKINESSRF